MTSSLTTKIKEPVVSFSHVQLYVDHVEDLSVYKNLEDQLNDYAAATKAKKTSCGSLKERKALWNTKSSMNASAAGKKERTGDGVNDNHASSLFVPQNHDVIRQLLVGFGFRVTGVYCHGKQQQSMLVTSRDPQGVQIIVTPTATDDDDNDESSLLPVMDNDNVDDHHRTEKKIEQKEKAVVNDSRNGIFDSNKVRRFFQAHHGRQGIAVLGFAVDDIGIVKERYETLHPNLFSDYYTITTASNSDKHAEDDNNTIQVLEVFAYYNKENNNKSPDEGTILRFAAPSSTNNSSPARSSTMVSSLGMEVVDAVFGEERSQPAYCDHWVSNVWDRTGFLDTLHDTLGFVPQVDFNAGVVAAGEAQIESTVTGNNTTTMIVDDDNDAKTKKSALRDQTQVYLPINNALSSVGHVHGFLQELGQGVQHVASRVPDLVDFVQLGNEYRQVTGEGFSFLNIPRSYYGVLSSQQLVDEASVSQPCAQEIVSCLTSAGAISKDGALDLSIDQEDLEQLLDDNLLNGTFREEYASLKQSVLAVVLRSRYRNLYNLLRDNVTEETYLGIVRNQILVDIQGEDLLYQIFTCNILQRNVGEEAPFFEFIQRVCSTHKVKPGCGGFGIRNFLTLFLSIEVSKAMQEAIDARDAGDTKRELYAQQMIDCFTDQLNESNPILTEISDAMTEEGHCKEMLGVATESAIQWKVQLEAASDRKKQGNAKLMECSSRYNDRMKAIREARDDA